MSGEDEVRGPTVYCADGTWRAVIPETTLRSIAANRAENAAVVNGWGVNAFIRAAKEALEKHDALARKDAWVQQGLADFDEQGIGRSGAMARVLEELYDRAVGA
jgi:hypothetical protein